MTPVQLPEVPAIARFNVTGDYCYPTVDDPEGACVSYDDHVAQLREYATEAVMAERARFAAIAGELREAAYESEGNHGAVVAFVLSAERIEELLSPSETNSER